MKPLRFDCDKIALLALCAAMATSTQAAAAGSPFLVYPGAAKVAVQMEGTQTLCGSEMTLVLYQTAADGKTVAKWYAGKVPGAGVVDTSTTDSSSINTQIEILAPDASTIAVIHHGDDEFQIAAAAASIGGDKTGVGLETFDPPLGADYLALVKRVKNGDPAAKPALAAKCPQ